MRWRLVFLGVFVFSVTGLAACLDNGDAGGAGQTGSSSDQLIGDFSHAVLTGDVHVLNAALMGTLGDVTLSHYATAVESMSDGHSADFRVTVDEGADGAAMAVLDIWDLSQLDMADPSTAAGVSIIGCAGPTPGDWQYDQGADAVNLDVQHDPSNPDVLTIHYSADLINYGQYYTDGDTYASADPSQIDSLPRVTVRGVLTFERPPVSESNDYGATSGNPPVPMDTTF